MNDAGLHRYTLGKRFAFVEFRTAAEATAGMQLNGISFGARPASRRTQPLQSQPFSPIISPGPCPLSLARPSDYIESSGPIVDTHAAFLHAAAASMGGGVGEASCRLPWRGPVCAL